MRTIKSSHDEGGALMKLSVVATLYHSAPDLEEFHRRVSIVARDWAGEAYEIILVNDGSPDASLDIARGLVARDPHLVVVDLSRNFGHHQAMLTGLAQSQGERVFLLDSDLEEEPEWLVDLMAVMDRDQSDMV
jgi:putative glycosyltransferase